MYTVLCSEFYTRGHEKHVHFGMLRLSCFELLFNVTCTSTIKKKISSTYPGPTQPGYAMPLPTI